MANCMNVSAEVETNLTINKALDIRRSVPVTVFEPSSSPEQRERQLTGMQQKILTDRIRGVGIPVIAGDLALQPEGVVSQLYESYKKLDIAAPEEDFGTEAALIQAALRSVHTKQISISAIAGESDLHKGDDLTKQQREMWDFVLHDNGDQSSVSDLSLRLGVPEAEIEDLLDSSAVTLRSATQAQTALFYLAYKKEDSLTPTEREVAQYAKNFYMKNTDIASAMFISVNTVKTHMRSVLAKLGIASRSQLADFYGSTPEDTVIHVQENNEATDNSVTYVEHLTATEMLVLEQTLSGKKTENIASTLGMSHSTAKTHLRAIYRKIGVIGISGLAKFQLLSKAYEEAREAEKQEGSHVLTATEIRVMNYVLAGLTNGEIALQFGSSVNTIKTHVRAIYYKLGVSGRKARDDRQLLLHAYQASVNSR